MPTHRLPLFCAWKTSEACTKNEQKGWASRMDWHTVPAPALALVAGADVRFDGMLDQADRLQWH
ncbi:hypothetical protein XCV3373 [Xanthomonas euvesicatoria pv. vesicatoria str. 85-10]|uniref:Uncharacterized protein n=1 Tax=Xanthomonas euvesicatoria pv. vesicatoria (strain 85-10) TaxID=316273 RepID=Q3BQ59_XANE5|nr:hypothetical protein XCV3373 [Xanthomonas euvesicatoria pv. vesicatoria str. 85-10]